MSKRAILPALMITLLLSACGGAAAEETLEKQRDVLAAAEEICFTAEVTASAGDEVFVCTLRCSSTPEEITAEVVEPESVAGVKASVKDGETTLRYEGVQLSVGDPDAMGPMGAVPLLFRALTAGHIIRAWTEKAEDGALLAAEVYADDDFALTLWFDADTLTPVHASLSEDGTEFLRCEFKDFSYQ